MGAALSQEPPSTIIQTNAFHVFVRVVTAHARMIAIAGGVKSLFQNLRVRLFIEIPEHDDMALLATRRLVVQKIIDRAAEEPS